MTPAEQSDSPGYPPLMEITVRIQVDPNLMVNADRWQVDQPVPVPACQVDVRTDIYMVESAAFVPLTQAPEHIAAAITRYIEAMGSRS